MKSKLAFRIGACAALVVAAAMIAPPASQARGSGPRWEVDPDWPKPLPDLWVLGGLGGVCVDKNDHVLILNRQDVVAGDLNAGRLAPPMIEFNRAGKVVNSWGDPKLIDWRLHSCHFDKDNNVWIAASPSAMVQKYSHDGSKLIMQMGKKGEFDSSDGTPKGKPLNSPAPKFYMPSSIFVDHDNGDIYVSDGESRKGNHRVAVFDRDGKFLRQWDPEGMDTVHCMTIANGGVVYVCNRENSRIQLYDKQGKFIKNIDVPWKPVTPPADGKLKQSGGSSVAIDFSHDRAQKYMFVVNQNNARIDVFERTTGKPVTSFGRVGKLPGEFDQAHGIAVDSKNNVYVTENRGRRVLKFRQVER